VRTVHLAASGGGHLELLLHLRDALAGFRLVWVTTPGSKARELEASGERVALVPPFDRRNVAVSNPARALQLALRERPRVVVSSGAGVVAGFVLVARLLGATVLFAETMARVRSGSFTGRALAPLAREFYVQWPGLLEIYPRARLCWPLLLGDIPREPASPGEGTFVTVGSHNQPFDRLLSAVERAAASGVLPAPVFAQTGASAFSSPHVETRQWVAEDEFDARLRTARAVISHGGAGVIAQALRAGRRPLVMGRRGSLGEHVDDHQDELLAELRARGLVVALDGDISRGDLDAAARPLPERQAWDHLPDLRDELRRAVEERW
jgi:UDP-N-acetylglucosamine transferase subunit ALG13